MALTYTNITYGPKPWHNAILVSTGSATLEKCYIPLPGGGWGLRDPGPFILDGAALEDPVAIGSLQNASSAHFESFKMVIAQAASKSNNGIGVILLPEWSVAGIVAEAGDYKRGYDVRVGGSPYRCTADHTPVAGNAPNVGGGATFWVAIGSDDLTTPRLKGRGEGSPAFGFQGAIDMQRLVAYLRANSTKFGIDPNKIVTQGSSAGGQGVGLAAFSEQMGWGGTNTPESHHPYAAGADSKPNAVILEITPTYLDKYITTSNTTQALLASLIGSLYGDDNIATFSRWDAIEDYRKRSLDCLRALERTGASLPTFFNYRDGLNTRTTINVGGTVTAATEARIYNGSEAVPAHEPYVHHPFNGWLMFEYLMKSVATGGLGRTDCRFWESNGITDQYRLYTQYAATPVLDTHYTVTTQNSAAYTQYIGDIMVAWMDTVL